MAATIIKPSTIDMANIEFAEPEINAKGGKAIKVSYAGEKFLIHSPEMSIAFDASNTAEEPGAYPKWAFQLSFDGSHESTVNGRHIKKFHSMIDDLDEHLIDAAIPNSLSWLKMKSAQRPVVEALINRTIKQSKDKKTQEPDGKYPDTMKVRIPIGKEGRLLCNIFDKDSGDKAITDLSVLGRLKRNARVILILECSGLYVMSGKFGFTGWSLHTCKIMRDAYTGGIPRNVCLITDSDDDDTESQPTVSVQAPISNTSAKKAVSIQSRHQVNDDDDDLDRKKKPSHQVADSDDDQDEPSTPLPASRRMVNSEDEQDVPVLTEAPKKKVITTKKTVVATTSATSKK
jgi:hypothetical protein